MSSEENGSLKKFPKNPMIKRAALAAETAVNKMITARYRRRRKLLLLVVSQWSIYYAKLAMGKVKVRGTRNDDLLQELFEPARKGTTKLKVKVTASTDSRQENFERKGSRNNRGTVATIN